MLLHCLGMNEHTPTAKEVYTKQEERARLDEVRRALADGLANEVHNAIRNGAMIDSLSWMQDSEYRALTERIAALDAELADEQHAIGGVVYRVADANLATLKKKLEALRKRAAKHDLGLLLYAVSDEHETVEIRAPWSPEDCVNRGINPLFAGEVIGVEKYTYVVIRADRLKIAGWALLAKLTVEHAGVFVSKVPAFARAGWDATDEQVAAVQAHLDSINLGTLTADEALACAHCGLDRRRKDTYAVENLETGEQKIVGSSCLRDFLGVDPNQIARYAEYLRDLEVSLSDDEDGGFGKAIREDSVDEYLFHVCAMLRVNGWAAKATGHSTAEQAANNLFDSRKPTGPSKYYVEPTEEDVARAKAALQWADEHLGNKIHRDGTASEFDNNLYVAATNGVVTDRTRGTLAYLPVAHAREIEREIERERRDDENGPSEYIGQIKERLDLTLTVTNVFEHEGRYGTTFITVLRDRVGNAFKWFGSYELERGATYTGTWTIKNHEEYKGVKQTIVNRPSKLAVADEAQQEIEVAS